MQTRTHTATPVLEPLRESGSRSAARVFRILAAIGELGPGAHSLAQITERLGGVPRSVVARILASGVETGFIERVAWGSYELSATARVPDLAPAHPALPAAARAALAALQQATNELVHLHAMWSLGAHHYACVAADPGARPELAGLLAAHDPAIGAPRPMRLGAAGHAMIPWLPAAPAGQALAPAARATRAAAVFAEPLHENPQAIRARGYALARSREGYATLAVPILSGPTATGALAVTARTATVERYSASLVRHLTTAAAYLQAVLANPATPAPA